MTDLYVSGFKQGFRAGWQGLYNEKSELQRALRSIGKTSHPFAAGFKDGLKRGRCYALADNRLVG